MMNEQLTEANQFQYVDGHGHGPAEPVEVESPKSNPNYDTGIKHPSEYLDKLDFLNNVNLLTHEIHEKTKQQQAIMRSFNTRGRGRRTSNPNPKYNSSNGFIVPFTLKRGYKKDDEFGMKSKKRNRSGSQNQNNKNKNGIICFVCEQNEGCKLVCGNCSTAFHPACIRVGGSKAPLIDRVEVCPNCIVFEQQKSRLKFDPSLTSKSASSEFLPLSPNKILNDMKSNIRLANKGPRKYQKKSSPEAKLKSNLHSTTDESTKISKKNKRKRKKENVGHEEKKSTTNVGTGRRPSTRSVKRTFPPGIEESSKAFAFLQELNEDDLKKTIISMTEAAKYVLENANANIAAKTSVLLSPKAPITHSEELLPPPPNTNTLEEAPVPVVLEEFELLTPAPLPATEQQLNLSPSPNPFTSITVV